MSLKGASQDCVRVCDRLTGNSCLGISSNKKKSHVRPCVEVISVRLHEAGEHDTKDFIMYGSARLIVGSRFFIYA